MIIGDIVYTLNAETGEPDPWEIEKKQDGYYVLINDGKRVVLPERCIFKSKGEAMSVLTRKDKKFLDGLS